MNVGGLRNVIDAAHVEALERGRPGVRYQLCGVNAPQIRIFELLREHTGRSFPLRLPSQAATLVGVLDVLTARAFRRTPLLTAGTVQILVRDWAFDSDEAVKDLGYHITSLQDGFERCLAELT